MKGALIQLLAKGEQDKLYLNNNPDIRRFKITYRKISNYVRIEKEQTAYGSPGFGKKIIYEIENNGDLLTNCMLQIKIPATGNSLVSWINSIGFYIIDKIKLKIGGITIDEYTSDYLDIYYKYSTTLGEYSGLSEMIKRIYGYKKNSNTKENILFVPLPFWFSKSIGNAFPLISLNNMDIKIEVYFKNLKDCLYNDSSSISLTDLEIDECILYTEMIYLTKDERQLYLSLKEQEYLIEQKQYISYSIPKNTKNKILDFNFNHPVKGIFWFYRDNYHKNRNEWNIYTANINSEEVNPIKSVELLINGNKRFDKRTSDYFRLVQPFRHMTSSHADYIYFYSFSDKLDEYQPSSYINMSLIDNSQLNIEFPSSLPAGELYLYAINYNHLKIKNGMAGILYQ